MGDESSQNDNNQRSSVEVEESQSQSVQGSVESAAADVDNKVTNQEDVSNNTTEALPAAPMNVAPTTQESAKTEPSINSPGVIVLQWLTYAFWGWTVIAMSFLTVTVLAFFIESADVSEPIQYGIAAVVVLLPVSVICDLLYSRREQEKKTGFASFVMIIHAVAFALAAIGCFITAAFSTVNLFINGFGSKGTQITLYSALIIAVLLSMVLFRTTIPKQLFKMRRYFIILMIIGVGTIIILGIFGPIAEAQVTRDDRLIESGLDYVNNGVQNYVSHNNKLPASLSDISVTDDAKTLVDRNLVTIKNDGKVSELDDNGYSEDVYRYQLCVIYKKASSNERTNYYAEDGSDEYSTYLPTYTHPAGNKCYKLKASISSEMYTLD